MNVRIRAVQSHGGIHRHVSWTRALRNALHSGTVILCIAFLFPAAVASGHGGSYRGPGDTVAPNPGAPAADPGPTNPPATSPGTGSTLPPINGNPGPSTGGPGGVPKGAGRPRTTGPGRPGPGAAPRAPAPGNPAPGPNRTPGGLRRRTASSGYEQWEFWWEHNRDPLLAQHVAVAQGRKSYGPGAILLGEGSAGRLVGVERPTADDVRTRLIPALLPLLKSSEADLVDSAVLSIARMTRSDQATPLVLPVQELLRHPMRSVRESATLALGVLGHEDALPALHALLLDTEDGARLCGRSGGVEPRIRAFAAAALGKLGSSHSVAPLREALHSPNTVTLTDLRQLCVLALGMVSGDEAVICNELGQDLVDPELDRIVRCQAAIALGRRNLRSLEQSGRSSEQARASIGLLLRALDDDRSDLGMLRSAVIALGMLGETSDPTVLEALESAVIRSADAQTRHFALISLARVAARDPQALQRAPVHGRIEAFLLEQLSAGNRRGHAPWAALALGLYGSAESGRVLGLAGRVGGALLDRFDDESDPSHAGALALALGLLEAGVATKALEKRFDDSRNQPLKGYLALSLALLGNVPAERFRAEITLHGLEFKYRLQLARALGVLADRRSVDTLVRELEITDTLAESAAMAQAIGLLGDRSAIDPLLAIVEDRTRAPLARGLAVVAIGLLAEKTPLPWNAEFAVDANYRAKTEALAEILDIL